MNKIGSIRITIKTSHKQFHSQRDICVHAISTINQQQKERHSSSTTYTLQILMHRCLSFAHMDAVYCACWIGSLI